MNEQIEVLVQQGSCMVSAILVTLFTHGLQKITPFAVEITKEFSLNRLFKFLIVLFFQIMAYSVQGILYQDLTDF